eukprot:scaffold95629_cov48-Prasinocladus_malaysianus.AAC.1
MGDAATSQFHASKKSLSTPALTVDCTTSEVDGAGGDPVAWPWPVDALAAWASLGLEALAGRTPGHAGTAVTEKARLAAVDNLVTSMTHRGTAAAAALGLSQPAGSRQRQKSQSSTILADCKSLWGPTSAGPRNSRRTGCSCRRAPGLRERSALWRWTCWQPLQPPLSAGPASAARASPSTPVTPVPVPGWIARSTGRFLHQAGQRHRCRCPRPPAQSDSRNSQSRHCDSTGGSLRSRI